MTHLAAIPQPSTRAIPSCSSGLRSSPAAGAAWGGVPQHVPFPGSPHFHGGRQLRSGCRGRLADRTPALPGARAPDRSETLVRVQSTSTFHARCGPSESGRTVEEVPATLVVPPIGGSPNTSNQWSDRFEIGSAEAGQTGPGVNPGAGTFTLQQAGGEPCLHQPPDTLSSGGTFPRCYNGHQGAGLLSWWATRARGAGCSTGGGQEHSARGGHVGVGRD